MEWRRLRHHHHVGTSRVNGAPRLGLKVISEHWAPGVQVVPRKNPSTLVSPKDGPYEQALIYYELWCMRSGKVNSKNLLPSVPSA